MSTRVGVTRSKVADWFSAAFGAWALIASLVTLLGWALDLPRLTDWYGNGISMQPNTALAAASAGTALVLLSIGRQKVAFAFSLLVVFIGGATLIEHLANVSLGIDTLLFKKSWGTTATVAPGRMGPPASTSFSLLGIGLLLTTRGVGGWPRAIAPWLGLGAFCIALLAIMGYVFGAEQLFTMPHMTGIALQTASVILVLAMGLVATVPEHQPFRTLLADSGAGLLARRALPLIIVPPIVLGWIRAWGQEVGLYDTGMGTAMLVVALIILMCTVLAWGVAAVGSRERALAAVQEAGTRADMVLNGARDQFVVFDRDWRYVYINERVMEVTGISRDEMLGKTFWEVWPAIVGTPLDSAARRVMDQRQAESLEYYYSPWDRWFDTRLYPTADGGIALFVLEITDRKRLENQLREADHRKDEFLATLAHELRNPLAPVRNSLEIMKRADGDSSLLQTARDTMDRQISQMERLIDDLMDVSRITRNKLELRKERVELAPIIHHAVEACFPLAEQANHKINLKFPQDPVFLNADAVRLAQVFGNLLTNACKYTERGGRILLTVTRRHGDALISIKDNGIGIPPDMLPHVFTMFTQIDRTLERSQGGMGIGLSLVRRLVELHDGTVTAFSEGKGRGSEFVLQLPILNEGPMSEQFPKPIADTKSTTGHRVLVVDDNRDAAISLAMLLTLTGHEALTAHDGIDGLAKAETFKPNVILLDIGLPKMNGYDVCRAIRQQPWGKEIVIVALTGWGQSEDRRKSTEAGFNGHLVKPVDQAELMKLLAGQLQRS